MLSNHLFTEFFLFGGNPRFPLTARSNNERINGMLNCCHLSLLKEFDVLLVFMFDRLGRREDETPFVVQWFVQQGIEVWSTREGEQRFDLIHAVQ